jgi:putative Holliday junction resolvase
MRIIGVDYGDARVGIAVSDALGITAQGLDTLQEKDTTKVIAHLCALAKEYNATEFVVGFPKNMNGTVGERGEKTQEFAKLLKDASEIPVKLWDERLTSSAAHNVLAEANVSGKNRKNAVDKIAAMLILQNYMESI